MTDVLAKITEMRLRRGWTEYQLAERSGLPQSTISSWYRKNIIPTIPSLEKVCAAFDITLIELLSDGENSVTLTEKQQRLLRSWSMLDTKQQTALLGLMESLSSYDTE